MAELLTQGAALNVGKPGRLRSSRYGLRGVRVGEGSHPRPPVTRLLSGLLGHRHSRDATALRFAQWILRMRSRLSQ